MKKTILMIILGCAITFTACDESDYATSQLSNHSAHNYVYEGIDGEYEVYKCAQCGEVLTEPVGTFIDGYETED